MSLATRCTSCGTVFRVVQDQLKVSEGWVRCGRCDAVFNAAEGLFDLDHESPPSWSPTQPPGAAALEADETAPPPDHSREDDVPERGAPSSSVAGFDDEDLAAFGMSRPPAFAIAAPAAPSVLRPAADIHPAAATSAFDDQAADSGRAPTTTAAEPPPSRFADRAQRDAFDHGDRFRTVLWGALLLLVVALAVQGAAQFSEIVAARWPAMQPVLARWCAATGCSVAAPRRIDDIVVDNSALAPVIGTDALKLDLALRNRADFAVAVPSIDLSLTDSAGQLIARRTLAPSDFRLATTSLKAGAELPLQALVTAGTASVTGYTVEIFYP